MEDSKIATTLINNYFRKRDSNVASSSAARQEDARIRVVTNSVAAIDLEENGASTTSSHEIHPIVVAANNNEEEECSENSKWEQNAHRDLLILDDELDDEEIILYKQLLPPSDKYDEDFVNESNDLESATKDLQTVIAYTDGACTDNGTENAMGGVGVWFANLTPNNIFLPKIIVKVHPRTKIHRLNFSILIGHHKTISEKLPEFPHLIATNQRAELWAAVRALQSAPQHMNLLIYTDSEYLITMSSNIFRWYQSDFSIKLNGDILKVLINLLKERRRPSLTCPLGTFVRFEHVKGHSVNEGNNEADRLATSCLVRRKIAPKSYSV